MKCEQVYCVSMCVWLYVYVYGFLVSGTGHGGNGGNTLSY